MTIFQIIAITLITLFYVVYFAKQIALRRSGIDTARLAKGEKPSAVLSLERWLSFATIAVAVIQYVVVLTDNRFAVVSHSIPVALQVSGAVIAAVGVSYFIMAVAAMRLNWRAGIDSTQDTELVSTGIYRFSRNPAFVGFDLLYIGVALMFPNLILILLSTVAVLLFHKQILNEEAFLIEKFGQKYSDYKRRTLRY